MSLKQTIEEFDPGHFGRRAEILEDVRKKLRSMGFFPLPLTENDIDCFWVTLETNGWHKDRAVHVSRDELELDGLIEVLKEVARYERNE